MKGIFSILIVFISLPVISQQHVNVSLIARNTGEKILSTNDTIRVFGFATSLGSQPGVPGPTIIANEGDSVHIDVWNVSQGAPHTIHLHGLDVDQENDGVPHLSFDIPHMDHGYYNFKAPHAGTYLYHCHVASTIHVQAGMYGLIVIKPSDGSNTTWNGGYEFTEEHSYFLSEIDTVWHRDSILLHDHDTSMMIHQLNIPDYHPQYFLINGLSDQQLTNEGVALNMAVNQIDYVRLANIGYFGVRVIFPTELNARIISSDGRPLNMEEISDTAVVYPGERFGVLIEPTMEFNGQIYYEYFNLNTNQIIGNQMVEVEVSGFLDMDTELSNVLELEIFPNPVLKGLSIHLNTDISSDIQLQIVDMNGNIVWNDNKEIFFLGNQSIYIEDLKLISGTYIVQVKNNEKVIGVKKFIKL
ncbi:MAG: hypothetical protein ACI9N1_001177 [Flavobacteriales bacterium]|jgi:hypothetical protein